MENQTSRRPLKSRNTVLAKNIARYLAASGISPNMISFLSMIFATLSLVSAILASHSDSLLLIILSAVFIQLRLLCNLMDGLVAVEFGRKSKTGDLWNDVPDRIADVLILLGAGYLAKSYPFAMELAWLNSLLAVMSAYLRILGASLKSPHYFLGPMAKPHRMALLTATYIAHAFNPSGIIPYSALIVMSVGQFITCGRRLNRISNDLETK